MSGRNKNILIWPDLQENKVKTTSFNQIELQTFSMRLAVKKNFKKLFKLLVLIRWNYKHFQRDWLLYLLRETIQFQTNKKIYQNWLLIETF